MKLARDTWLILQYEVMLLVRNPIRVGLALIQPLTYLALFTPFLKSVMGVSSYSGAFQLYVPSLFCAMGVFSGLFAGFDFLAQIRQGVITRLRVTPVSRVGLLLGRELEQVLLLGFEALVVTGAAAIFGLRVTIPDLLLAVGLLGLMVLVSVSISYIITLLVPNESALSNLMNSIAQPAGLLAGYLIPLSVAPLWVRDVALWNPFAWGTNAMRAAFQGQAGNNVIWQAILILAALTVAALLWTSRLFRREIA